MSSVRMIDLAVTCPPGHQCFCMNDGKRDVFVAHENVTDLAGRVTHNGGAHPMHKSCAQRWLVRNPICPTCRIPISNQFISKTAALQHILSSADRNLLLAEQQITTPMVMGAATIALMAAIEFSGLKGAKDILAIGGGAYAMGGLYFGALYGTAGLSALTIRKMAKFAASGFAAGAIIGNELYNRGFVTHSKYEMTAAFGWCGVVIGTILAPFIGNGSRAEAGAEERITTTSRIAALTGMFVGTTAWFFGKTQDSTLAQICGIVAVAKSTGLMPLATGAVIGFGAAQTIRLGEWFNRNIEQATAAAASAATAIALHAKDYRTCPAIPGATMSAMATRFGITAVKTFARFGRSNLTRTQSLVALGVLAGFASAAASTLLHRAYRSYQRSRLAAA